MPDQWTTFSTVMIFQQRNARQSNRSHVTNKSGTRSSRILTAVYTYSRNYGPRSPYSCCLADRKLGPRFARPWSVHINKDAGTVQMCAQSLFKKVLQQTGRPRFARPWSTAVNSACVILKSKGIPPSLVWIVFMDPQEVLMVHMNNIWMREIFPMKETLDSIMW